DRKRRHLAGSWRPASTGWPGGSANGTGNRRSASRAQGADRAPQSIEYSIEQAAEARLEVLLQRIARRRTVASGAHGRRLGKRCAVGRRQVLLLGRDRSIRVADHRRDLLKRLLRRLPGEARRAGGV